MQMLHVRLNAAGTSELESQQQAPIPQHTTLLAVKGRHAGSVHVL